MEMKQTSLNKYWEILNLSEDYYRHGYKQKHPPAPRAEALPAHTSPAPEGEANRTCLDKTIRNCRKCDLHHNRNHAVPGGGASACQVLVVGDFPSGADDREGKPFCGKEGAYLDKWLEAIRLNRRNSAYLCYAIACRPPEGQTVSAEQRGACFPYLETRIRQLAPRAILCTGLAPGQLLTGNRDATLAELRGRICTYDKIPLVVTHHPREVLENNSLRGAVWSDLKLLRSQLV